MEFDGWSIVRKLGEGGQGTVSLVVSPNRTLTKSFARDQVLQALNLAGTVVKSAEDREKMVEQLVLGLRDYARDDAADELGALKQYKINDTDGPQARQRFAREVEALKAISHPNLLQLLTANVDNSWMITKYYDGATLDRNTELFKNRPLDALSAFRGLVEGVARLHETGAIHRDIKPANIFVTNGQQLVLGDFGIVFVEDGRNARVTETFERVGTRDWMPAWAHTGTRIDDVKPSFDVFSLGKVLWSMLSGMQMLQLWYFDKPRFNLAQLFPKTPAMRIINDHVLSKCVVEEEADCLKDASALLECVDSALDAIKRDRQFVGEDMRCQVCAPGTYVLLYAKDESLRFFATPPNPAPNQSFGPEQLVNKKNLLTVRVYRCSHCGNLAMFQFPKGEPLPAWKGHSWS